MGAGVSVGSEPVIRKFGFILSLAGWGILAVSLFLERTDLHMSGFSGNRLIDYRPIGLMLVLLLAMILPAILFARRFQGQFIWILAGFWLLASALTIYAGFHVSEYSYSTSTVGQPAYAGVIYSNDPGIGTILSIIGANLGFVGTGLMALSRRDA